MNRTGTAIYRRGRRAAFLESHGNCVKCGREAMEAHHVYGPTDDSPENLRALCYRCHLVAPAGDAYWVWEESGESGPERFMRTCKPIVRAMMMDLAEEEFNELYHLTASAMMDIGPRRMSGSARNPLLPDNA